MATAAPHVKLLRQLASAKDDYLSGAFDISWDGAKATLYLVFGRPSHAVFDTDQAQIEGEAAIDALLAELPRTFAVSDWRRAMSPQETLSITIDELAGPFVRLAGSYADDPVSEENPEWWSADDSSPDLAFGLADFPLLPGGRPLWAETSPENVNLAERLAELPPSILILTGAKLRAAAVVSGGDLIDAVWIDDEDQARGEAAGMAIARCHQGLACRLRARRSARRRSADHALAPAARGRAASRLSWLDPASMLAAFRADGLDRVLVIDAPVRGIALFSRGGLVAVYSETQRSAVASPERLRSLLSQARGRLTVMERKPRPVAATATHAAPSATDFFGVLAPEAPAEADLHPEEGSPDAAAESAETGAAVDAGAAVEADAPIESDAAADTDAHAESTVGIETEAAGTTDDAAQTAADTEVLLRPQTSSPRRATHPPCPKLTEAPRSKAALQRQPPITRLTPPPPKSPRPSRPLQARWRRRPWTPAPTVRSCLHPRRRMPNPGVRHRTRTSRLPWNTLLPRPHPTFRQSPSPRQNATGGHAEARERTSQPRRPRPRRSPRKQPQRRRPPTQRPSRDGASGSRTPSHNPSGSARETTSRARTALPKAPRRHPRRTLRLPPTRPQPMPNLRHQRRPGR